MRTDAVLAAKSRAKTAVLVPRRFCAQLPVPVYGTVVGWRTGITVYLAVWRTGAQVGVPAVPVLDLAGGTGTRSIHVHS